MNEIVAFLVDNYGYIKEDISEGTFKCIQYENKNRTFFTDDSDRFIIDDKAYSFDDYGLFLYRATNETKGYKWSIYTVYITQYAKLDLKNYFRLEVSLNRISDKGLQYFIYDIPGEWQGPIELLIDQLTEEDPILRGIIEYGNNIKIST